MEVTIKEITVNKYNITLDEDKAVELMFMLGSISGSLPMEITNQLFDHLYKLLGGFDNPKYQELVDKYPTFYLEASSY